MKKLIVSAFSLGLLFTATTVYASNNSTNTVISVNLSDDEKVALKPEELPESIKKTLSGDAYKGWAVKEASLVKSGEISHYEVSLNNEKEVKVVKFDKDGALVK